MKEKHKRYLIPAVSGVAILLVLAGVLSFVAFNYGVTHADSPGFVVGSTPGTNVVATSVTTSTGTTNTNTMGLATTINNLNRVSVVGSTAFIVNGQGHTVTVDANPYGIAIAPRNTPFMGAGSVRPGDIVVTNFGANNTGTTLVRFPAAKGPGLLFNTTPSMATKGPAFEAFNTLTGSDWVSNFSGNNVQVFRPNGTVLATITSGLFDMPWGQAFNQGVRNLRDGAVDSFFITNAGNATIDRIDVIPGNNGTIFRVFQIGQLTPVQGGAKDNITWVPSLRVGGHRFFDVLLAVDPAAKRVAAYPSASTLNTTGRRSNSRGITVFQGQPLNMPGGLTVNPLNGDLLVVNLGNNNLVELNVTRGQAVGVRQLDNVPVDPQTGNGSALFGVAAARDAQGNLEVFFTDDNTNTLDVLSV
jgi:hypothetical protein